MDKQWYYKTMGETVGPLGPSELRQHAIQGRLSHDTLVTREGADKWFTADQVKGLFAPPQEEATADAEIVEDKGKGLLLAAWIGGFLVLASCTGLCAGLFWFSSSATPPSESSGLRQILELSDMEKNDLWWEVEGSNSRIADLIEERYSQKGSLSDVEFVEQLDREVRGPIAEKYGVTYDEMKRLFREGETAPWRSDRR